MATKEKPELGPQLGPRPDWDSYFMLLARLVSSRSTCLSRPTGAVIVQDKHILATGYNGSMPGLPHCTDEGRCFRRGLRVPDADKYNYCRATHAEANALAQAARYGISVSGATMYCTLAPCYTCLKLMATAGITVAFYELRYESASNERDTHWEDALLESGIRAVQLKLPDDVVTRVQEFIRNPTSTRRLLPE